MLSAGTDQTFRLFNFALEQQNRELSQQPILKKLGLQKRQEKLPIVTGGYILECARSVIVSDFSFSETRQRDWGDVVTAHQNHANVYVWRFR